MTANYFLDAVQAWKASRKQIRSNSWAARVSDETLAEILRLYDSKIGYFELREICKKQFELKLNDRQLSDFLLPVRPFILPARITAASRGADLIAGRLPQLDEKNRYLLKQTAFEVLSSPIGNERHLATFADAILRMFEQSLKEQDLAIKRDRLRILEEREKKARATIASRLTDAEKAKRLREIFKKE